MSTAYHLRPGVNGITEEQLEAIRSIAIDRVVTRGMHDFWFETNETIVTVTALCVTHGLQIEES